MIQQESLPIWNYGRGHAITTGRITYLGGPVADLDDPSVYRIEGALKWSRFTVGASVVFMAELDADGITPIVYASGDLLSSTAGSENIHGMVKTSDGNLSTGAPAHVMVTLRDIVTAPETGTDLDEDQALCVTVVVSQVGRLKYSQTLLPAAPPVPAPMPPPPPDDDRPPPRVP
jgi:hypothetical protein